MEVYALKIGNRFIIPKYDGTFVLQNNVSGNGIYTNMKRAEDDKRYLENIKLYKGEIKMVSGNLEFE